MKNILSSVAIGLIFSVLPGCGSQVEDLKSESIQSSVPTTEANGVVTATVSKDAEARIVASGSSTVADSSINIPAGSLAITTDTVQLAAGEASDQTTALASALGVQTATIGDGSSPFFVGGVNQNIATTQALQISIPLPITSSSIKLADNGQLVLLYLVYTSTGYKAGLKILGTADLRGIFVESEVAGLGFYRVVYIATKVEAKEISVTLTPSLKSSQSADK